MHKKRFLMPLLAMMISGLACGGGGGLRGAVPSSPDVPETPTPVPIPTAPAIQPENLPEDDDLRALIVYANQMGPLIAAAGEILERDGEILRQAEENDQVLCDGRLASDSQILSAYLDQVRAISAPSDAEKIHSLVIESGEAWTEAMTKIEQFCSTGNALHKIPAAISFWEAAAKIQDAGNRFWLLMMAEGVEAWVQR